MDLECHPATPDRWADLEKLFGPRGAFGGCWCMWWRTTRAEFSRNGNAGNKRALKKVVSSRQVPGILAYANGEPIAWCSVAPRETYGPLERSPTLKRVDDQPVWSIVCFYVAKPYRGQGLIGKLLRAAVEYAKENGARIVEGYPEDRQVSQFKGYAGYMGLASTFRKAGFMEVLRRLKHQPIMRYIIEKPKRKR